MVQRKLDYYLQRTVEPGRSSSSPSPSASSSFLHLPYRIRYRIYLLVGLVRFCPINLNQEAPRAYHHRNKKDEFSDYACFFESRKLMGRLHERDCVPTCRCAPLPVALVYISRAISQEVLRILYSQNSFTISKSHASGLRPLKNLSTASLSCLRVLTVRLNNCECIYRGAFQPQRDMQGPEAHGLFSCHPQCQYYGFHDRPLQSRARQHAAVLQEWQDVACRLAAHCRLDSLRLDFVCDTEDLATAQDVVDRLSPIKKLEACSIRLSRYPNWQHSALARETARRLMGRSSEKMPDSNKSRTYILPPEVLFRILEYSELLAPFDLEWNPDRGLSPFDCCKTCTTTLDCCTCSHYHGAHSQSCTCWRLPLSIFLVSHQVYDIAKTIFYQRNRFIILPKGGRLDDLQSCQALLSPLSDFFESLPPRVTPLLRSIGLVVSLRDSMVAAEYNQLRADWAKVLTLLLTSCDPSTLSLNLYMGHAWETVQGPQSETALHAVYRALTQNLEELSPNLRDLFIYLQWPTYATADETVRYSAKLEEAVLGSEYDSAGRGKWTNLPRLWYDGMSREGLVLAADGRVIWPREYTEDAYGPPPAPPYSYV
ncbi:hypothetical protein EsDP_00004477 [Epichloe bromicola]|uniref:Uncharacterized protein n=1 Tax=Epichloe bromicola TaxID=79588 RepID=A0ABQ0CRW4_9HYPO